MRVMAPQRRIIAVGFDDGFDRELETALADDTNFCVEAARTRESARTEPEVALWVMHVAGTLGEVPGTRPILAVVNNAGLAETLELMGSERVAAVVTVV